MRNSKKSWHKNSIKIVGIYIDLFDQKFSSLTEQFAEDQNMEISILSVHEINFQSFDLIFFLPKLTGLLVYIS